MKILVIRRIISRNYILFIFSFACSQNLSRHENSDSDGDQSSRSSGFWQIFLVSSLPAYYTFCAPGLYLGCWALWVSGLAGVCGQIVVGGQIGAGGKIQSWVGSGGAARGRAASAS